MIQPIGLVCAFFASAGFLWALVEPCWKETSADLEIQPYSVCYGLWKICTSTSEGMRVCDMGIDTPLDFGITPRNHYCRSATIIAIILTTFALFLGGGGSECCKTASWSEHTKAKYRCWAGWMFIISALLTASGAAWYTYEIYQERVWFVVTETPGFQNTISRGIYIIFGSALLDIIAGACFAFLSDNNGCCTNDKRDDVERSNFRYSEKQHTTRLDSKIEYV